jgi:arginase
MYLDGHTDFVLPSMSQTAVPGMDLAIVTGHGHHKLTNIHQLEPYFEEENVWCIGNRYWDSNTWVSYNLRRLNMCRCHTSVRWE